ncbi:hypothetical protein X777_05189 [Ooceraea biroi]|uniref:Uncharacterized protein n=1 Tax=Ooceraea biroi TaxID=2015173 RepID=A0A026WJF8_OOCBI|nr:hypothetical protein X777_05189 [Ooceraea biroi]
MRTTGRSTPRRGARDHAYNKPVVPFETHVSRAGFLRFVSVNRGIIPGDWRREEIPASFLLAPALSTRRIYGRMTLIEIRWTTTS